MTLEVHTINALRDNYVWLLREPESGAVGVVDPSEAAPVEQALQGRGWRLSHIFNTHHHPDHTGGNLQLKTASGCTIVGPAADRERIPGIDVALADGETYAFGKETAQVLDVPGHTRGHIAFFFPGPPALFCGDTMFSLGCGRLFEGTPAQMWASLGKFKRLPPATQVYCGHEYTQANARFAVTVDPDNPALKARMAAVEGLRAAGRGTVPSRLGDEFAANPFLRADQPALARAAGLQPGADPVAVFAAIRAAKDRF